MRIALSLDTKLSPFLSQGERIEIFFSPSWHNTRQRCNSPAMTDKLPPNLLALFAPRPPLRWVPPSDHAPEERRTANISGVADFLPALQLYKETDMYKPTESWLQMKDRKKLEKEQAVTELLTVGPTKREFSSWGSRSPVSGSPCANAQHSF